MIVSDKVFIWFNIVMVAGICLIWGLRDIYLLTKLWKQRREKHDEFFGSLMGLVIVTVGAIGIIRYHQGL